jgi:hypothetical protein
MNKITFDESAIEFSSEKVFKKLDENVPRGLMSVDFEVDYTDFFCLIEVKNYENPKATEKRKKIDYKKLTDPEAAFPLEIGMKIKDTLLKKYTEGAKFDKPVLFLLVTKFDFLEPAERITLYKKIDGYIPTGLNGNNEFKLGIKFDMPSFDDLNTKYGIIAAPTP